MHEAHVKQKSEGGVQNMEHVGWKWKILMNHEAQGTEHEAHRLS